MRDTISETPKVNKIIISIEALKDSLDNVWWPTLVCNDRMLLLDNAFKSKEECEQWIGQQDFAIEMFKS